MTEDGITSDAMARWSALVVEHTRTTGSAGAAATARDLGSAGVGIGLYIARQIIEAHGGTIRCDEAASGGARFVMKLLVEPAQPVRMGVQRVPAGSDRANRPDA